MRSSSHSQIADADADLDTLEEAALRRFKVAVRCGEDWFPALLTAIGEWSKAEEIVSGRHYRYLVGNEAFDWLLLAERILLSDEGFVPADEKEQLLFHGRLPKPVSDEEFRERIGEVKHQAVMNYWYGVRVEEALVLAVEHEIRKASRSMCNVEDIGLDDLVYQRIYGKPRYELLEEYFAELEEARPGGISLAELQEFTYWLFKRRVKICDKEKVASDTKKALAFSQRLKHESTLHE